MIQDWRLQRDKFFLKVQSDIVTKVQSLDWNNKSNPDKFVKTYRGFMFEKRDLKLFNKLCLSVTLDLCH